MLASLALLKPLDNPCPKGAQVVRLRFLNISVEGFGRAHSSFLLFLEITEEGGLSAMTGFQEASILLLIMLQIHNTSPIKCIKLQFSRSLQCMQKFVL